MSGLDDRIRAGLTALAPEPARSSSHAMSRARRARARRRQGLAAGAATVTAVVGVGVGVATSDGDQPTQILDTDVPSTTAVVAPTTTAITPTTTDAIPAGVVPQLVPLTTEAAVKATTDAGFVPEARPVDVPAGAPEAGRVITQNPPAGTTANKGTTVQFTYGRPVE
jgi:hypothetical protein